MRITVHYMAQLRRLAGIGQEEVDIEEGMTPACLLTKLADKRPEPFRQIVLNSQGKPHPSLLLFVGDEQVPPDTNRILREGDIVTLLTPMAGG